MDLKSFSKNSQNKSVENKKFLQKLKKKNPRDLDDAFHSLHQEVFSRIDCLTCANCCKTTSPIFYSPDIERIAKFLKMKPVSIYYGKPFIPAEEKSLMESQDPYGDVSREIMARITKIKAEVEALGDRR